MTLSPAGSQGAAPKVVLPTSDKALRLRGGEVPIRLGHVSVPSSVAAYVEINGTPVATYATGLAGIPRTFPLAVLPAGRRLLARSGHHRAKLVVEVYSSTGLLRVVREDTIVTT
jgi:hypothetical protein